MQVKPWPGLEAPPRAQHYPGKRSLRFAPASVWANPLASSRRHERYWGCLGFIALRGPADPLFLQSPIERELGTKRENNLFSVSTQRKAT